METVSEKKKRGRPSSYSGEYVAILKSLFADVTTDRGIQNHYHKQVAFAIIREQSNPDDYLWICDLDQQNPKSKSTILAELGRCHHDDLIPLALEICQQKMKSVEAVAFIRRKTGKTKAPNENQLAVDIVNTITKYIKRYPSLSNDELNKALDVVRVVFNQNIAANDEG